MENMVNRSFLSFWKNKKVFVTGHTGFKGSWMIFFYNLRLQGGRVFSSSSKKKYNFPKF